MKILNINIFYNEGSTGKIVADIHTRLLRDGHDSHVIYGRGKNEVSPNPEWVHKMISNFWIKQYGRISRITGLRYNCAYFETFRVRKLIKSINPDVVHLHCVNCFYINPFILLRWLGRNNYNVLVTHHADVTITANCDHAYECEKWKTGCQFFCPIAKEELHSVFVANTAYSWYQMKQAFSRVKHLYASGVSKWMVERVRISPFFKDIECRVIENGIDTNAFYYRGDLTKLREKFNLVNKKVVLHVTPSFRQPLKGGRFVIELAKRMPHIIFIVIGIKNEILNSLPVNMIIIPYVSSKEELSKYYSMANLTLLTSQRESFSLVTAESLCCGTPVIGFEAGAPEVIALPKYSQFVKFGDMLALEEVVKRWLGEPIDKPVISHEAIARYDAERMYRDYLSFYKDIIEKE